jgi:signal transduction histidine kinase
MGRLTHTLASVTLCALLGFGAFAWNRRVDERACARYGQQLRALLALDVRLTAEVMRARAGLVAHYDMIVQTLAARQRLQRGLRSLPAGLWGQAASESEMERALTQGEQQRAQTDALVERFKREHAVLRNSLRFLPVLAGELEHQLELGAAPGAPSAMAALIRDELLLQSWQDSDLTARIDAALASLAEGEAKAAPAARPELATLVSHARVVREYTPTVQQLTRQIAAAGDAAWTETMLSRFLQRHRAVQQVADFDASVCFVLAFLGLGSVAASIILKLRSSASALRLSSQQLTQTMDSLRVEQAKQKELGELKSRFVAMTSHEFRTPLSVIVSSSELLQAYAQRWSLPKQHEHFQRIEQAAARMTRMLDDILSIGRHEAGLLRFEPQELQIDSFCTELVEALGAASGREQRIVYHGPAGAEQVVADPILLRHMLENLLVNALKYSPDASEVEFAVAREEEVLRFDVCDQGIGISEEDQQHLFETFHRGKNVGAISGTGLGLSIVRGAVELHGGNITVQSSLGRGTQFTVRIPCVGGEA